MFFIRAVRHSFQWDLGIAFLWEWQDFAAHLVPPFSRCSLNAWPFSTICAISGAALNLVGVGVQQIFHPLDHALQFFRLFSLIEYEA